MAIERTLSIIKPDAVAKNVIGEINSRFEKNGLHIIAAKMLQVLFWCKSLKVKMRLMSTVT